MLTADAMGLGAWIHASLAPPVLLGDPKFRKQYGPMLGFDCRHAALEAGRPPALAVPLPKYANLRANPVGLRHKGEQPDQGMCPPNYDIDGRGGRRGRRSQVRPDGIYRGRGDCSTASTRTSSASATSRRPATTRPTSSPARGTSAPTSTRPTAASRRTATRSTCPASGSRCTTSDQAYYEQFFRNGLTDAHRPHDALWH